MPGVHTAGVCVDVAALPTAGAGCSCGAFIPQQVLRTTNHTPFVQIWRLCIGHVMHVYRPAVGQTERTIRTAALFGISSVLFYDRLPTP